MRKRSTVTGGKETREAFRKITSNFGPALNQVSRLALRPMLRAAKAGAPKDSGDLRRALVVRRVKGSPANAPVHRVGVRSSAKGAPVRYAHLAEWGRPANADGSGGYTGHRFMTKAFDSTKGEVEKIIADEWPRILRERIAKLRLRRLKAAKR